ncbi:dihydropteroate synthase [Halonotius terrestris]|uniref:Probable bifunctional folylpolyglutamate synthase/dihydropteroate synthase n=1 Tax=Halonotius terrestris TaxID=2487750 RepID=A0A8J8TBA9_9EURY|nr:dihydropteroate synthase [Halonotius terrestris]TQQ79910.1 dihydropteroate synthase [Halonotius terrestris]
MEYHEAVDFLFDLRRFQVRPGIESAAALRGELDDPGSDIRFVQVAGSNGKGSTAKLAESVLREAGYSVGLYTSPHLETLNERIQVDGRPITDRAITEFVERVKPWLIDRAADGEPLTFFEVVTLLGIWYFDRQDVDIAVLEVGLGGEFDATSVVDPVASCVTTVSLEHTSVLGDTIEEIATTKAKVAPDGETPLVTGATGDALAALRADAGDVLTVGTDGTTDVTVGYDGRVTTTESQISVTMPGADANDSGVNYPAAFADGLDLSARLALLGEHQALNAGIATTLAGQAIESIESEPTLDTDTLRRGLRNSHWPGRFEVLDTAPLTVFDGAHNADAIARVAETLSTFEYDDLHVVFGAMHDKPHAEMVAALPTPTSVITCRPNLDRAEDPAVLARCFENEGIESVTAGEAVADAISKAETRVGPNDCLLVTGSLFAVGEARSAVTRLDIPKRVDDTETATEVLDGIHATAADIEATREDTVHRTIATRVDDRQAAVLRERFPALGGDCVSSGVTTPGERHEIVLSGTLAEFRALTTELAECGVGLPAIAADLREQLGLSEVGDANSESAEPSRPWDDGTAVMGILNVTPDSFYDGGDFFDREAAIEQAESLVESGADIIDIGGESTRPGAEPVSVEAEIDRVVPVIDAVAELDVAISIDTRKAEVAEAALDAGADIVNDVTGLDDSAMRELVADREVPVILMHSIDAPVVPGKEIDYDDVVEDILGVLNERLILAEKAGIPRERIIVDPGLGFGKTSAESFELLDRLGEFDALGCPVLVGHSRKSMFSEIDSQPDDRLEATVAATALAAERGADIVRVHDVAANRDAVDVVAAVNDPDSIGE